MKNKLFITIIIGILFSQKLSAQTTYAVVVGISDYQILDYRNGDLRYADKDAGQFVKFLQSKNGGYVPASHIIYLPNEKATKNNILAACGLFKKAQAGDKIYFYYSGHGATGVFVPYDVQQGGINLLRHSEVKAALKASKAQTKILMADACLAGSMKKESPIADKFLSLPKAFKDFDSPASNVVVILSSRSYQNSRESGKLQQGTFTYYLLKALYGGADKNKDNYVTIKETFNYISPKIKNETRNQQAPIIYGKFDNNLILSTL
ncbi:MAG: caspase family protein [Cytophagaceae bacterium]|nr:caspase family protein [Cytophagaceae bacterium]